MLVALLCIGQTNANALTREMLDQFTQGVDQLQLIDGLRVLIVQAAGPVFCAGMDLAQNAGT